MPTLRQLQYLVAIADTLSFRRAAELCHVSQPSLSDQIRVLEDRLQAQLIERNRRRILITPLGRDVVERARRVLREVQDIRELAQQSGDGLFGTLRCGVLPSLGPYLLPLILPHLHRRYPALTLYLREDGAAALESRLADGDLDLLLSALPVRATGMTSEPLFREPLWLALPLDHPLAAVAEIEAAHLGGLKVLTLETAHSLHDQVLTLCSTYGAEPLLDFATTSLDTLRQMAGMGMGAAFLPALYVRAEALADEQIAVRPFATPQPTRTVALIWRALSAREVAYRALAREIRAALTAVPEVQMPTPA